MVHQLTKFHVQRVDMVINPPWNLPFLGAKGLTSPEQTATVEMVFSQPWTCTFLVAKGLTTPEALKNSCCKDKKRRLEVLQIKNNLKNSIYNILRKLKSELSRFRRSDCGEVLDGLGPNPVCGLGPLGFLDKKETPGHHHQLHLLLRIEEKSPRIEAKYQQQQVGGPKGKEKNVHVAEEIVPPLLEANRKLEVWSIDGGAKTPVASEDVGKFYSGDCYIVLYSYHSREKKDDFYLFYWIGKDSAEEDQNTAAKQTTSMFNSHKGRPVQGRIYQDKEPPQFVALFQPMVLFKGGLSSSYKSSIADKGIDDETYSPESNSAIRILGIAVHNNKAYQVDHPRVTAKYQKKKEQKARPSGLALEGRKVTPATKYHLRLLEILFLYHFVATSQSVNALAFVFEGVNFGASDIAYAADSMVVYESEIARKRLTSEENHAVSECLKKEAEIFDAWHDMPEVNPSPFEKQLSFVYTQAIFKNLQVEVLGVAVCHLKIEKEDGGSIALFVYAYDCGSSNVGCFTIPVKYVQQRWMNADASRIPLSENLENVQTNIRRLNDLCRRAIIVGEEGSISQEL
ncbi:villin-3-like protein isoform X1 [Tanacetum coccineum]